MKLITRRVNIILGRHAHKELMEHRKKAREPETPKQKRPQQWPQKSPN